MYVKEGGEISSTKHREGTENSSFPDPAPSPPERSVSPEIERLHARYYRLCWRTPSVPEIAPNNQKEPAFALLLEMFLVYQEVQRTELLVV